jgi:hypothetical protein
VVEEVRIHEVTAASLTDQVKRELCSRPLSVWINCVIHPKVPFSRQIRVTTLGVRWHRQQKTGTQQQKLLHFNLPFFAI